MKKYQSPNSGQSCTAAQYAAEIICTRQAQHNNVDLPFKFWNDSRHQKKFKTELFKAYALIKLYSEEVLIRTINNNKWLLTLLYKDIGDLLDKEQKEIEILQKRLEQAPEVEEVDVNKVQKKFVANQGKLSKFKDLD